MIRTDLALEKREMHPESELPGVIVSQSENEDCKATVIEIISPEGEKSLGKSKGKYITLEMDTYPDISALSDGRHTMLRDIIASLVPEKGTVLVAGLGNGDITPDAVGPLCAERIFATRHIPEDTKRDLSLPYLRSVAVISPGVTGKTGIETGEIIAGIKEKIKPSCIILIDALAARSLTRLGNTVQISNSGIEPGSGVGNRRFAINEQTMGIPVIAIGIPTVVDAATMASDITGRETDNTEYSNMFVTPKDTDMIVLGAARLISFSINCALQKELGEEEIMSLAMQ